MTAADAAQRLDVSPGRVRSLLSAGPMNGTKIGNAWVISHDDFYEYADRRAGSGRPWSPGSAWDVLMLASGRDRARSRLARSRRCKTAYA